MTTSLRFLGCALLGAAAIVFASGIGGRSEPARADGAALALQPPSQVVHVGENVTVDIAVSGVTDLAAWEVTIKYDPTVVSFSSYSKTSWLDSSGRTQSCPSAIITSVTSTFSTAKFGCGSLDPTPPGVNGGDVVAHATFTANAIGTTNLELLSAELALPEGSDCCGAVTTHEGAVQVIAPGAAETTPPPTPTPNPIKMTPTAIPVDPNQLTLPGGSRSTPAAGGSSQQPGGTGGASSPGGSPSAGGGSSSGVLGASGGGLFGGSSSGSGGVSAGATGAPHAGDGTVRAQHSLWARVGAVSLALAGQGRGARGLGHGGPRFSDVKKGARRRLAASTAVCMIAPLWWD
jgi:uncharacterized membrane protein YgcG